MRLNCRRTVRRCAPSSLRALPCARRASSVCLRPDRRHRTAVAPQCMHDHRQLARHGDAGLAVAGALGDRLAPALDLVGALEARHQSRRRLVERAPHVRVAGLRDASLDVDRRARLPASRGQPEVGRDVARERRKRDGSSIAVMNESAVTGPTPGMPMKRLYISLRTWIRCNRAASSSGLPPTKGGRERSGIGVVSVGNARMPARYASCHCGPAL